MLYFYASVNIIHWGDKMIKMRILGFEAVFDFSFFAVISLFLLYDRTDLAIMGFTASIVHELSHIFMMTAFDIPPKSLVFYGGGIRISEKEIEKLRLYKQAFVISAGCVINFLCAGLAMIFSDGSDLKLMIFALSNLLVGAVNLLPIGYFDGARLLKLLFIIKLKPERVDAAMKAVRRLFGIAALVLLIFIIVQGNANFTIYIIAGYFIFSGFSD